MNDLSWRCAMFGNPGCTGEAATTMVCTVEGRDLNLCVACVAAWRRSASQNTALRLRCPRCAPSYMANAAAEQVRAAGPVDNPVLAGPLADVLSAAMSNEGITADIRQRVLSRLHKEALSGEGYICQLLRTTAEPPL